ncbi:MAG: 1-deoxy-D-xylulose-5-phosphate synthase [Candidatus Kapabacteria bacterium]|nr:1-deoxy-D-xylulose-5-phosphate synthase [Ignavibacteriota bacterium]MCW5885786.1 1-deoxy-D-xylulose-5-phosphate synthase [Candidatus Kapabacteria bacterium]
MTSDYEYKYLLDIDSPKDLRKLPKDTLPVVCDEVREFMIDTITRVGGHFGAGLGVVELTVALHYVFNTPTDKIIFDTGHQGYPHKILTGRRELLQTIRQYGGISGFLKRTESPYDAFGAGHASTSISAGLGMATARDLQNKDFKVVSVIGDGAMTGGLAYEAMNNIGVQKRDMIVILNDNNISIEPNVSAFSNYFNEFFASSAVNSLRRGIWDMAGKMDSLGDRLRKFASRLEDGVKAIITPGALFETLGFQYFGPINGNNVQKLVRLLSLIKDIKGPIFLHIITQKGKGYAPAEKDAMNLHAIGKVDKVTGKSLAKVPDKPAVPTYSAFFGDAMVEICKMNSKVVGITAAMADGTGLIKMEKHFPDRLFDVGIAEGHAVTFAAGLACEGIIPVCAIYSSFLQRAFDHLVHDCAIQGLHVIFALDRAGLVGADGATHHGVLDVAYLRSVQQIVFMAPKDEQELRDMLYSAVFSYTSGPVAIRFPRGNGFGVPLKPMTSVPLGKGEILKNGKDIAVIALGTMTSYALEAANQLQSQNISVEVVNPRFIKPLDTELLKDLFARFEHIITIEDGQIQGGFGSAVVEYAAEIFHHKTNFHLLGIPDKFIHHGTQEQLHAELGIDVAGLKNKIIEALNFKQKST